MAAFFMKEDPGSVMHAFIARLFPICRSITGDGVRKTLRLVQERIPIEMHEVPTGTQGLRLERAEGMEYQRRLGQRFVRQAIWSIFVNSTCTL